jgi:chaperonin GroEL (HSP60 family)
MDLIDALTELRSKQSSGAHFGIDARRGRVTDMFKLDIVDPLAVKEQVIKSATEAACMLLRIDDVIASSKSSGPSGPPGGMGGMGGMPGIGGMEM